MYFSTSLVLGEVAAPFPEIESRESRTETWGGGPPSPPHSIPPWSAFFSLSFSLTLYLPPYPSIYRYIYLSSCPSMYVFIYLSLDLSIYLSIYLLIYLFIYLFIDQGSHRSIYLSIDASISLSIYSSIYLFIYSFIYLSIYLSIYRCIDLSIYRGCSSPIEAVPGNRDSQCLRPAHACARARARRSTCMQDGSRARREVTLHLTLCF